MSPLQYSMLAVAIAVLSMGGARAATISISGQVQGPGGFVDASSVPNQGAIPDSSITDGAFTLTVGGFPSVTSSDSTSWSTSYPSGTTMGYTRWTGDQLSLRHQIPIRR